MGAPKLQLTIPPALAARFEVCELLGTGAFSEVFRVERRDDGEVFALKVVPIRGDGRREEREVQLALDVQHPFLIHTYEAGRVGDHCFILQEVATGTLEETIRRRSRLPENWQALCEAATGLWGLHQQGLVHRDLKPSNVMITASGAKLGDLGLARHTHLERLTHEGMILGTPGYMAPEQARGEILNPAADIYALAVMFYEALEGRLPYVDVDPMMLVIEVGKGNVLPFDAARTNLDPDALRLLEAALSPTPAERPESLIGLVDFPPDRMPSGGFPATPGGPARTQRASAATARPTLMAVPRARDAGGVTAQSQPLKLSGPEAAALEVAAAATESDSSPPAQRRSKPVPARVRHRRSHRNSPPRWVRYTIRVLEVLVVVLSLGVAVRLFFA